MNCRIRERLLEEWKRAAELYAELGTSLSTQPAPDLTTNLQEPTQALQQIGQIADKLYADLAEHIKQHGCGSHLFDRGSVFFKDRTVENN